MRGINLYLCGIKMKKYCQFSFLLLSLSAFTQNVQVSSTSYTPQELIEDILINSPCIESLVVTNVVGGDFGSSDKSYGYFDASGSSFPLQTGIVLSTGKLNNVGGPNATLSDDDAPNWSGDLDLETSLNEINTLNATIIEFNFSAAANQISFKYLFASEEYQEGDLSTCQYSDLFGFLIRKDGEQQYTNIATVPNTETPVKVTTVHPEIPGECLAINETYFGSWNASSAPINFNGQTAVLTATATIIPNELYNVKLVIADEQNYRYDSAVFLEANSFELGTDLGTDRLFATNNPLCENETLTLEALQNDAVAYQWYKNDNLIPGITDSNLVVDASGVYRVEVLLSSGCTSYGSIEIEYSPLPIANDTALIQCAESEFSQDTSTFNLNAVYDEATNMANNSSLKFYKNRVDAEIDASNDFSGDNYTNITNPETLYVQVLDTQTGCYNVSELILNVGADAGQNSVFTKCDTDGLEDGFISFNLGDATSGVLAGLPPNLNVSYYETYQDAVLQTGTLPTNYTNNTQNSQVIFARIEEGVNCYGINTVELVVYELPQIEISDELVYCLNDYPNTINLSAGLLEGDFNMFYYNWSTGETTSEIQINEPGNYTVSVTNTNGCSKTRTLTVLPSDTASIEMIEVIDGIENNTVTVTVSGEGDYEYALDSSLTTYQDSSLFSMVTPGFHTIYVRDKNGCGIVENNISVIGFPKFFTPNGDGFNDTWHVYGINTPNQINSEVYIFDRFGKLLTQINAFDGGWDGTFNGALLPNSDYWFSVKLPDNRTFTGHFTLKR